MNNEQFRKLISANSAKSSQAKDGSPNHETGSRGSSSLGSRQRANIPMTPRAVGNVQADFAKQMAQRNQQANPTKSFKAAVPRGVKMAAGYTDRSKERDLEDSKAADDRAERLKALEESLKNEEIDNETYERLRFEIAGGDLESTHLVKGLDFKLLERVRRGEDVYSGKKTDDVTQEEDVDVDDAFDALENQEVQAIEKEKAEKKKGQLSTVALAPGKKRTRDQILAEFKAARAAAKIQAEPALGDRFRKIGAKQQPGTRIERDRKGREVMIIVDADGHEKRKVRKSQPGDGATDADSGLLMPDKDAKPLGMEVPEQYRNKEPVVEDEDVDIFDDVGDDYDPLAGMDAPDSDSDSDGKDTKAEDKAESSTGPGSMAPPPPPPPKSHINYFKGSKTSLLSEQENQAPSMSDPAMVAAIKRAAALRPLDKGGDEEGDSASDDEAAQKAKADEARRKKLLQNEDRDAEDMDMGFGTSRYEDEEDFDDRDIKLSAWGDEGDGEEGGGGGRGGKKRKRNRKRKGDVNNAADVLRDVFAILLAAYHPRLKLLGISSVFGNAPVENTTQNAASVLTAIGKQHEIPLHVGLGKALERPAIHAPDIHGESGLDGTDLLPTPDVAPSAVPAIDAMAAALRAQAPGTAWLVATGSLTNVAALLRAHPDLAAHLKGLSLMGGSFGDNFSGAPLGRVGGRERIGNITPFAEFNIIIDPEAAAEVFGNPVLARKTTVVPLDLSHQVLATASVREMLLHGRQGGAKVAAAAAAGDADKGKTTLRTMLVELLYFFSKTYADVFGITEGPPLHDPLAVAAVLTGTPDEITFHDWDTERSAGPRYDERFDVSVVTAGVFEDAQDGKAETGRTVGTLLPRGEPGVRVPRSMDVAKFWDVIEDCVERADAANAANGRT
ncbi:hypothetical protein V2A60_000547 [Cordyceps javanica]